jgi:hypothetical protein
VKIIQGPQLITPAWADIALEDCKYPNQRELSDRHVKDYVSQMQNGDFLQYLQIVFGQVGGEEDSNFLLDGQHRLWAITISGLAQYMTVTVLKFPTAQQMHDTYRRMDVSDKPRRARYIMQTVPGLTGVVKNEKVLAGAYAAAPIIGSNLKFHVSSVVPPELLSPHGRLRVLEPLKPQIVAYNNIIGEGKPTVAKKKMAAAAVTAVALILLADQPIKGEAFLRQASAGDELPDGHPARKLWQALAGNVKQQVSTRKPQELLDLTGSLWNRFQAGDTNVQVVRNTLPTWGLIGTRFSKVG